MAELPMLDLTIVENDPNQWREVYGGWIENARGIFNSPHHELTYQENGNVMWFGVLPPVPPNRICTYRNVRLQTIGNEIIVKINNHNLYVSAFLVRGTWYAFKGTQVGVPCIYMDVDESYTEVVPKVRRSQTAPARTREHISLGRDAIISAVNDIASPWFVNDEGIAIVNYRQAKGSVILFQMLSEAIRFQTVLETLLELDVGHSDPRNHSIIWQHQNDWSHLGQDIHKAFKKHPRGDEEKEILRSHYFVRVILSDTGNDSSAESSPSSSGSKGKNKVILMKKGEESGSKKKEGKGQSSGKSKPPLPTKQGRGTTAGKIRTLIRRFLGSFSCVR